MPVTKPTDDISWGLSASGGALIEPTTKRALGWNPGDEPPAEWLNWWQRGVYRHANWLAYRGPLLTTAAGSSRSDAVAITDKETVLNASGANQGIIFTTALRGLNGTIWNGTGYSLKVYPVVGETLLNLLDVGVTTPYPVAANDSPVVLDPLSLYHWASNEVGPGGGGGIPGSPAWNWLIKKSDVGFPVAAVTNGALNLNGYRKGTWTPVVSTNGTNNVTHSTQTGKYVRVGDLVTVNAYIVGNTGAGSTGSLQITGLPFSANSDGALGTFAFDNVGGAIGALNTGYGSVGVAHGVATSTGVFILPNIGAAGQNSGAIATAIVANQAFTCRLTMSYVTDAVF